MNGDLERPSAPLETRVKQLEATVRELVSKVDSKQMPFPHGVSTAGHNHKSKTVELYRTDRADRRQLGAYPTPGSFKTDEQDQVKVGFIMDHSLSGIQFFLANFYCRSQATCKTKMAIFDTYRLSIGIALHPALSQPSEISSSRMYRRLSHLGASSHR